MHKVSSRGEDTFEDTFSLLAKAQQLATAVGQLVVVDTPCLLIFAFFLVLHLMFLVHSLPNFAHCALFSYIFCPAPESML